MVEAVLDLFEVHREMVARHTAVVVEHMFGVAPEALNAVDVIAPSTHKGSLMVNDVMLAVASERLVTAEGIGVVDRALAGMGLDMAHQLLGGEMGDDPGIHASFPFQQAKNDTFTRSAAAAFAFSPPAEVGLVEFNLALEFAALELGDVEQRFAQPLVNTRDDLGIDAEILGQAISRLQLVEALEDFNLTPELRQALALATVSALHVTARGVQHAERTAENALATPQKVGRTGKMTRFPCNHKHLSYADGYETP